MRRVTLILSDLYLPAEAARETVRDALGLPDLSWLLARAHESVRIADWRAWLSRELGADGIADWPAAHVRALSVGSAIAGAWLATPVRLEARLDHVRLMDRGLLRLAPGQADELCTEFARTFGPQLVLLAGDERGLLLTGGPVGDIPTVDPARLIDCDIGPALPAALARAGEWRRLGAEIEMWLPGSSTNATRARAGQKPITSLWLWGGGDVRENRGDLQIRAQAGPRRMFGSDPHVLALNALRGIAATPAPLEFAELGGDGEDFVELAPMSGGASESLAALETSWFAPARAALSEGTLEHLRVVANDRCIEVDAGVRWRFWRRRRGWLESLA